jgi:malonyl-CoA O-methyltransferase
MKDTAAPPLDQVRVERSFRRGLQTYHDHAVVQARVARQLAQMLAGSGAPPRMDQMLEFGCGTGHLTGALLDRFAVGRLTLNDLVPLAAAEAAGLARGRGVESNILPGPVEALPLPGGQDLIAAASAIQWVEDIPALLSRLAERLRPGGWLALSGFGRGHFRELAELGSGAAAPGYADAEEWRGMMPAGLEIAEVRQEEIRMLFPTARDLLRHLQRTGVNGQARGRWTRSRLARFEQDYRRAFGQQDGLPLTYDAVWVLARRTR